MHGPSHSCLTVADTRMSKMKAPNSTRQFGAITCRSTVRFSCDFAHRGRDDCAIGSAGVLVRRSRQSFEIVVKLGIIHFDKISPVKRIDASPDLRPQYLQFQPILSTPLLQRSVAPLI